MDNYNALARILVAGGICADDRNIAELDRAVEQARCFFDFRTATNLDKRQSAAFAELISKDPAKVLSHLSNSDDYLIFLRLLYNVPLDGIKIDGRIEEPITTLLIDLCEAYFQFKGTRKLGGNGPHYRFTKACMEYLSLADAMPNKDTLRVLVSRALKRRYPKAGSVHGQN